MKQHPQLSALVVDQALVINEAPGYWQGKVADEILNRLEFQSADILSEIPAARDDKDIYFLCGVLHGYEDSTCHRILDTIRASISDTGARVAIMEMIVDEKAPDVAVTSFDMQMFTSTSGKERT